MSDLTQQHRVINLDNFKYLFPNDEAFNRFGQAFVQAMEFDFRPIVHNDRIIGSTLSAEGTKEVLYGRIAKRISEKPEILDELVDRIENDDIVD